MLPLFIGTLLGLGGAAAQSALQIKVAREQMDFQERMSNTQHQRGVADLRAAGLNPVLSAKYGGATSPPGALAQVPDFQKAITSSLAVKRNKADLALLQAQTRKTDAEASITESEVPRANMVEQVMEYIRDEWFPWIRQAGEEAKPGKPGFRLPPAGAHGPQSGKSLLQGMRDLWQAEKGKNPPPTAKPPSYGPLEKH